MNPASAHIHPIQAEYSRNQNKKPFRFSPTGNKIVSCLIICTMMGMCHERAEQPFVLIYPIWEYTHLLYFINLF